VTPTTHVFLWLWKGWRPIYDRRDINAVVTMIRERGGLPDGSRIHLLTDQATDWYAKRTDALGVETHGLWADPVPRLGPNRPNCFRRLKLFSMKALARLGVAPGDIVMSMDADSIVAGQLPGLLLPMLTPGSLVNFMAMGGLASPIHGSLFAFRAGTMDYLWDTFHPIHGPLRLLQAMPDGTPRPHGSDQAWMSRNIVRPHLWHKEQGCYAWSRHGCILSPRYSENAVYWSFAGHSKPGSELVRQVRPDLAEIWADAYGRT
jgi:hypothetical protein